MIKFHLKHGNLFLKEMSGDPHSLAEFEYWLSGSLLNTNTVT